MLTTFNTSETFLEIFNCKTSFVALDEVKAVIRSSSPLTIISAPSRRGKDAGAG